MKTKEYYIKLIIGRALYFNEYWGDELPNSELINNTDEAVETLQTYCTLLKKNKKCVENNFEANPDEVKLLINNIVKLIWGDTPIIRELPSESKIKTTNGNTCWTDTNSFKYHIHAQDNGFLYIENKPQSVAHYILNDVDELLKILESKKHTADLEKYYHKWYYFEGYEGGSAYIYISEINYIKNKYVFTGGHVFMSTENTGGDGVLINDVEDMNFYELPYSDEVTTIDELTELLDSKEETTLEIIKSDIINTMNEYWFDDKEFMYANKQIKNIQIDLDNPTSKQLLNLTNNMLFPNRKCNTPEERYKLADEQAQWVIDNYLKHAYPEYIWEIINSNNTKYNLDNGDIVGKDNYGNPLINIDLKVAEYGNNVLWFGTIDVNSIVYFANNDTLNKRGYMCINNNGDFKLINGKTIWERFNTLDKPLYQTKHTYREKEVYDNNLQKYKNKIDPQHLNKDYKEGVSKSDYMPQHYWLNKSELEGNIYAHIH